VDRVLAVAAAGRAVEHAIGALTPPCAIAPADPEGAAPRGTAAATDVVAIVVESVVVEAKRVAVAADESAETGHVDASEVAECSAAEVAAAEADIHGVGQTRLISPAERIASPPLPPLEFEPCRAAGWEDTLDGSTLAIRYVTGLERRTERTLRKRIRRSAEEESQIDHRRSYVATKRTLSGHPSEIQATMSLVELD
jgi:hypothetical protein